MKKAIIIVSALVGLIGIVWFGQGIGIITGSVMTNDPKWAVIGVGLVIVAGGIFWFALRKQT